MNARATLLLALLAAVGPSSMPGVQAQRVTGVVAADAPVTLLPDPDRTPLAILRAGTVVQVLGQDDGWFKISFQDSYLLGDRIGYIRAEYLKLPDKAVNPGSRIAPALPTNPVRTPAGRRSRSDIPEARIAAAIAEGYRQPARPHGLRFVDMGQTWVQLMADTARPGMATGFQLQIHNPIAWIQQLASAAAEQKRTFTVENVTDEMVAPVLRVAAYADVRKPPARGQKPPRVSNVVLRNASGEGVQPLSRNAFSEHVVDARGGRLVFEGLRLSFPLDDVRQLRGARGDRPVFITVIGANGEERPLELTNEHFAQLPK